jgi:predicted GNAT family acetyltransferase
MSIEVHNDEAAKQFYTTVDGHQAVIRYAKTGDVYDLEHTFVPEELRGEGLAEQLVVGALTEIRNQGARFIPTCPYIQTFLKRHPEQRDGEAEG